MSTLPPEIEQALDRMQFRWGRTLGALHVAQSRARHAAQRHEQAEEPYDVEQWAARADRADQELAQAQQDHAAALDEERQAHLIRQRLFKRSERG